MRSDAPDGEKEFETASQTRKHQITRPIGIRISPSLRGKATSFLTTCPFSEPLETAYTPGADDICAAVGRTMECL